MRIFLSFEFDIYRKIYNIRRKMIIVILLFIVVVALIILQIGKKNVDTQFDKKVIALFSHSKNISEKKFTPDQLKDLPEPVKRYFQHVLKEGQPYISSLRLTHDGQFKKDLKKSWMDIQGEEYFVPETSGYVWKGKTSLFTAIDQYIDHKGRLTVYLLNLIKVADGKGEKYDQGELLRWLGESVCFPTNLLPKDNLQWLPINDSMAKLNFQYRDISIYYLVSFNDENEITKMETERYMGDHQLEKWITSVSDYKEFNGMFIPTKLEAAWQLNNEYFPYAKFNIRDVDFNISQIS